MDNFNKNERDFQRHFSRVRDAFFLPAVSALDRLGVHPDLISVLGVAFLICGVTFTQIYPQGLVACLGLYLLCDGIDGPLARHRGETTEFGSLLDIVCDQCGLVALSVGAALFFASTGFASLLVLFSSLYIAFIVIVVYANNKEISIPVFIRTKYVFYGLYCVRAFWPATAPWLGWFVILSSLYYAILFLWVLYRIRDFYRAA